MKKTWVAVGLGMVTIAMTSSCVSNREYREAQSTIEQYRADSAQWADRNRAMQQNISDLEQKSRMLQSRVDSMNTASRNEYQRWQNFRSIYDQQRSTTEKLHQDIHQAIDKYVDASSTYVSGGKVMVNLKNEDLFTSRGTSLNYKGKETVETLASILKENPQFDVAVVTTMQNQQAKNVAGRTDKQKNYHSAEGNLSFKSTPSKKFSSADWNTQVNRATAIARALNNAGVQRAGIIIMNSDTRPVEESKSTGDIQIVLSPKMDSYYNAMEGYGSTGKR